MYSIIEEKDISTYDGLLYDIVHKLEENKYSDSMDFISELMYTLMELQETEVRLDKKLDMLNIVIKLTDSVPERIKEMFNGESEDNILKYWSVVVSILVKMCINKRVFHNMDSYFDHDSICLTIKHV